MINNLLPSLPKGISVANKPNDLENYSCCRGKWAPIIESLKVIDSTKCIEMDITGKSSSSIVGYKQGIKAAAKKLKFTPVLRFAKKNDTLFVWTNR